MKISPYAFPGIKKIFVFTKMPLKRNSRGTRSYVKVAPVSNKAYISIAAVAELELCEKDRIIFFIFGESICICKCKEADGGTVVVKKGGTHVTWIKAFCTFCREKLGAQQPFICDLKKTNSEFNGQPLFNLVLPYRYKRTFFVNQYT
jgi:hypothetical protein